MSSYRKEVIGCPQCLKEGEMLVWDSVNVTLNPELREKVFSGELFVYRCPHCGKEIGIPVGTLYHDMKHRFLILFAFFKPDDYDYSPMEIPLPVLDKGSEYTFRVVFGLNRLREKILILEQGLDDVAIERQKYMLAHLSFPEMARNGDEIYFEKIEEREGEPSLPIISFIVFDKDHKPMWESSIGIERYYQHKLSCSLDPRMKAEGYCCVDEGWISKRLKEE